MSIPFCVMVVFQINVLLNEIGAIDLSGAGAGVAVIREIGPIVTVLVVAGAGATAICADLGSRTIREEIDAMKVLGIDPIQRLAVPRVIASCGVAVFLNGLVTAIGLAGDTCTASSSRCHAGSIHHRDPDPHRNSRPTHQRAQGRHLRSAGRTGGLPSRLQRGGGPKGVGDAVNQTVVFSFVLLFLANAVITTLALH